MPEEVWKVFERVVAEFFETFRNPLSGENSRHTAGDVIHPDYLIECKYRKKLGLFSLWRRTRALAEKEGKIPILAFKERGVKGWIFAVHAGDLKRIAEREAGK